MPSDVFWGYSSQPPEIGHSIEAAAQIYNNGRPEHERVATWPQIFRYGAFIDENILAAIDQSNRCFFDVTIQNFNVFYEIGYSIGRCKPIVLVVNKSLDGSGNYLQEIGLFDTVGISYYEGSDQLISLISSHKVGSALFSGDKRVDRSQPLYLLDSLARSEFAAKIVSAVKESKTFFRSFDPKEEYRMSIRRELQEVSSASGVLVSILPTNTVDHTNHNLRAAFLAGLSHGMDIPTLIIGLADSPAPLDVRDLVRRVSHPDDLLNLIKPFCIEVISALQKSRTSGKRQPRSPLERVNLGASAAENEFRRLGQYFIDTAPFRSAMDGRGRIVVGRKGSGKTAIFWQVRDRYRASKSNLVLDLKPDGYQLRKFKEVLVDRLSEGTKEHSVAAFWEYALYLELAQKVIESDERMLGRDPRVTEELPKIIDAYHHDGYTKEGDFSERLSGLLREISRKLAIHLQGKDGVSLLQTGELTEIIYRHDMRKLREAVASYLSMKDVVLILVDNIDKGWEPTGVSSDDLMIIRTLLEGLRKIEHYVGRSDVEFHSLLFLRNDVFELLLNETPDRGKEAKVVIDWGNRSILKELIEERIKVSSFSSGTTSLSWSDIAIPWIDGIDSFDWILDRCLMRPRYLIDLVDRCLGHAISMHKEIIDQDALREGYRTFALDVVANTNYELRDIEPSTFNRIYILKNQNSRITLEQIRFLLLQEADDDSQAQSIADLFVWFGILGVVLESGDTSYIYDVEYNHQVLKNLRQGRLGDAELFEINKAFWSALNIMPATPQPVPQVRLL